MPHFIIYKLESRSCHSSYFEQIGRSFGSTIKRIHENTQTYTESKVGEKYLTRQHEISKHATVLPKVTPKIQLAKTVVPNSNLDSGRVESVMNRVRT